MKKLVKIGLILLGVGILSAFGTYMYVFHKPHRNVAKEKPLYTLEAQTLLNEFLSNEKMSYEKYGDQVLQITGKVVEFSIQNNGATLVYVDPIEGVSCSFDSTTVVRTNGKLSGIIPGDHVTVKGKCDGYDLIMGVVLTRCILVEKEKLLTKF
jgi:hypothetical protein